MAFDEEMYEPRMISYLDLYVYAGQQPHLSKSGMQKCSDYTKDVLMGLPALDMETVMQCLEDMGMDIGREIEVMHVFHKPICMAVASRNEDKPKIFGLVYVGFERKDPEWLLEKD